MLGSMDFKDYLKTAAEEIDAELERFLKSWSAEVERISPSLPPLADVFIQNCYGGKRLRGALVKLGYEITRDRSLAISQDDINKIAAAVEIFQTAILAHDDIIDQSPTRRGRPTVYMSLGGDHYGISQTIALADIGFFLAVRLLSSASFPAEYKNQAIQAFSQTVINTCLGEVLDVELPHLKKRTDQDVIAIHTLKTAYYTIIDPLRLGIILAGGDESLLASVEEFGKNLGIAFQIQDDILGVFGDEETLGKSVTSDIAEGKNTLLITQAFKKANAQQKQILDQYYGKTNIDQAGVEQIKKVFIETGALEFSKREAGSYVKISKSLIPKITQDPKIAGLLDEMGEYLVRRSK